MATSDMLRQAIADAKIIKETAIANAKNALEEAFTPKLKELLSEKIEEMDMEEEMDEGMYSEEEKMHEKDMHEGDMDEEMHKEEMHKEEMHKEETSEPHGNIGQHTPEGEPLGFLEGDMEEEMTEEDLEEMLKEMEKEMHEGDMEEGEKMHEKDDMHEEKDMHEGDMDEEKHHEEKHHEEKMHEEMDEEKHHEEKMHEEVSDEDLMDLIKDVVKSMADAGELEGVEVEFDETEEEGEEEEMEAPETEEEETEELAEMRKENAELKEAVEFLTTQLNEINVLNAKLLYVNKIFKAKNLSESKKVKLLSQFDGASSIKEVKLVYNTVVANLAEETKVTKKTSLKEGVGRASKPSGVSSRKPIVNVDPTIARFQKLAGIR
jgi:hypothetical protein